MRYSRERQESLVKQIVAALKAEDELVWEDDPETVRRRLNRLLGDCDKARDHLERRAEEKVASLKRRVPQGSAEWEILVRKHLGEEFDAIDRYPGV